MSFVVGAILAGWLGGGRRCDEEGELVDGGFGEKRVRSLK
jgi:hypothetical protein